MLPTETKASSRMNTKGVTPLPDTAQGGRSNGALRERKNT